MHTSEGSTFKNLQLPVTHENCYQKTNVITRLYYEHIRLNVPKTGNLYQRTDLAVLSFLNTTGCRCQMILTYFICKMVFDDRINCKNCYDNCMYNCREAEQVPVFKAYNMTAKLDMMNKSITKYSNLLLSSKRQSLLVGNLSKRSRTAAKQIYTCEEALNNFVL